MNIEHDYLKLLKDVLENGKEKEDRTGTGTISVFGRQIRHDMSKGFPLLTTKKMYWKGIVTELLWFLRGDTNIKYLVDNDCHIWDGDAYKKYENHILKQREIQKKRIQELRKQGKKLKVAKIELLSKEKFINKIKTDDEFTKKWGELGPVYGRQWRNWTKDKDAGAVEGGVFVEYEQIDQIKNLIEQLKTNPDSRRLMVNAWNVGELDQMTLPPCHYGFQVYTRELSLNERHRLAEKSDDFDNTWNDHQEFDDIDIPRRAISLMWNQRSVDSMLGLPFNIVSYALLLHLLAKEANLQEGKLIGFLGDTHIYQNHFEGAKEQLERDVNKYKLPKLETENFTSIFDWNYEDTKVIGYESYPRIKFDIAV